MASTSVSLSSSVEKLEEKHKSYEMEQRQKLTAAPLRAVRAATKTAGVQAKPHLRGELPVTGRCLFCCYPRRASLELCPPCCQPSPGAGPASPVLGGSGMWGEEDVLDNTGVLLSAAAALT